MNQATNVNIVPSYGQRGDLHFSQYDVGRTATINLYAVNEAYTIPVGATVKIQATKPSGLGFDVACTFSGSVVTVVSTETMTEEAGRFPCELRITKDSDVIGTANFMFVVEPSPHPDGTIDGDAEEVVNEIKALVLQSEGYALGTQDGIPVDNTSPYYHNNSKWWAEHPVGGGLTEEFKQALLDCFQNVAWIGNDGQDYYDALNNVLYPPAEVISISAVYTQSGTVYDNDSLDSLKADLVVTATYDDSTSSVVNDYTLSGTLEEGTSTITVSYGGKTTTFNVTVTHYDSRVLVHRWDFTQGLNDLVGQSTAEIANATQDSEGLHLTSASSRCFFGTDVFFSGYTAEVDIASTSASLNNQHGRLLMALGTNTIPTINTEAGQGFIFRNTGVWAIYRSPWVDSTETNPNLFSGKTLVFKYYKVGSSWYTDVYVGDTLICSSNKTVAFSSHNELYLGSTATAFHDAIITEVRIYNESGE